MKSLGKLKRFGLNKSDGKEKRGNQPSARLNDLAQASQDMQDMRNCYDSLLSAAAATTNSAYEFSESLRDMGTCLLEKTAVNEDDECSELLSVLGNVQFELQKLVDSYRSHVVLTITSPSESLLSELRTVEEMKRQCDEKRNLYEYMVAHQREKGKSRSGKVEVFTSQELQATRDEYDEDATLCVFRLKSLKQGQCRSLLTQAARHHAAQLNLFRKGLKSLEALEPYLRVVTEKQHIDYEVSGFVDGEDECVNSLENDDGELSFDYRLNKQGQGQDAVSTTRNSMEVDQAHLPRPQASTVENAEEVFLHKSPPVDQIFNRDHRLAHSAPIFSSAKKFDPAERVREMHSYVLPTPGDAAKSLISSRTSSSSLQSRPTSHSRRPPQSLWHPLEPDKREKNFVSPPLLAQGFSLPQFDLHNSYDAKKFKRQAFSAPLTNKPMLTKPALSASGPITPTQLVSGVLSRAQIPHLPYSPPIAAASSPKISELHELPRPPAAAAAAAAASKTVSSSSQQQHSEAAPLAFRNQQLSPTNRSPSGGPFSTASPLPTPPLTIPRSYSIPNQRDATLHVATLLQSSQLPEKAEEIAASPPLAHISLLSVKQPPNCSPSSLWENPR